MSYGQTKQALAFAILCAAGTFCDGRTIRAATTTVVVQTGQAVPNGNGTFLDFAQPFVLDNSGTASFVANLTATSAGTSDNAGIYGGNGGPLTQLARKGQAVPGGGTISSFESVVVSDVGQVALRATLTGTGSPVGIYRRDGGSLTQIARTGQGAPGGDGTISSFALDAPALNDAGQVAFVGGLTGTLGGSNNNSAVFRGDGGALTQIARKGQTAPDGNGSLNNFGPYFFIHIDSAGEAAFGASLLNTLGGTTDDFGIFQGAGGQLTQIAREGQTAPDGNGRLSPNGPRANNNSGQVVFRSQLTGTAAPGTDDAGIFRGNGGPLTQIARRGQNVPDGNGRFSGFSEPVINDLGQAVFSVSLTGTIAPGSDDGGIFRGSGGALTQILRAGQSAPDGNGTFTGGGDPDINNHGQVAFVGGLTNTIGGSTDNSGIFLYDDNLGVRQVVRTRQTLLGRLIVAVNLHWQGYGSGNGLNESGQVAYWFRLADGYQGVAIWSASVPGDYNGDSLVDAADYVVWRKNDGTQAGYNAWRANFGTAQAVGSGSVIVESGQSAPISSIPEPTSILLSVFGAAAILVLGRRYRLNRTAA